MADIESLDLQITANVQKAQKNIDSLVRTLDKLKKATSNGCGLGAVSKELGKIGNSSTKFSFSTNQSSKSLVNLGAKALVAVHSLKKVGKVVGSWISESNDYVENLNLFTVSMGEYAASAQQYAEQVGDVLGIDPSTWMRNQGVFMTLGTGFGVATDRAATMSQQLTQLGYDISSFFNISVEDAMQKLQSGISGELEPLRRLGYDLSQAKLEATALSLGIDKAVSSMTQAEKAELRYYAIMTQVTSAQGDMARTLEAPANQLRILKAQVDQAARALGNIFIPALNAILPYAIAAVKIIRLLANSIANLVGFTLPEVDYSGVTGGAGDVSDSLEDATDKAKKFKKMLLGIDELNVMSDNDSGSSSDSSTGGGFDFELPTYDFIGEATNSKINMIVEQMKEWLGITGEINSWSDLFETRLGRILKNVGLIGGAFALWKLTKGFLNAIGVVKAIIANPVLSLTIGATIAIVGFTMASDGVKDAIANGLDGFNFTDIVSGGLLSAGGAALLGSKIAVWLESAFAGKAVSYAIAQAGMNLGLGTVAATGAALAGAGAAVLAGLAGFITGIWDSVVNGIDWWSAILTALGGAAVGGGAAVIATALGTAIAPGLGTLIGLGVGLLVDGIILLVQNWDAVSAWFGQAFASIGAFFSGIWQGICDIWNGCAEWFDTTVIQPVVGFFVGLWKGISSAASTCWNAVVEFFTPAVEWFSELFGSIFQCISDIFYNIGVIAQGCWWIIQYYWGVASGWFNDTIIQPVSKFFSDMWAGIKGWAISAWEAIAAVFSTIGDWINEKVVVPVSGFFSNMWAGFKNGAVKAWEGVKSVFSKVGTFFSNVFSAAWEGVIKVFSIGGEIFVAIKDAIVTAFKFVVNGIIKGLNSVIAVPFNAINGVLNWLKSVSIVGYKPFSSIKTITVPQIPLLAEGGIVDAGQMFIAREAGPELVASVGNKTAVMNNDQIVESVSKGVYQAVSSAMGGSQGSQVVEAKVNDKVLFEVVVSRARQEAMRTGTNPLLGGV